MCMIPETRNSIVGWISSSKSCPTSTREKNQHSLFELIEVKKVWDGKLLLFHELFNSSSGSLSRSFFASFLPSISRRFGRFGGRSRLLFLFRGGIITNGRFASRVCLLKVIIKAYLYIHPISTGISCWPVTMWRSQYLDKIHLWFVASSKSPKQDRSVRAGWALQQSQQYSSNYVP